MAPKSKKDRRAEAAKKRRKQLEDLKSKNKKRQQDLKVRSKTRNLYNRDSRGKITDKKKGLSNIPVQERSAPVNKKSRGLSNLGSDYKKQEEKLSKIATKKSAKLNKGKYPKMGTYKNKDGKSVADEKKKNKGKGYVSAKGYVSDPTRNRGRKYAVRSAQGRKLLNKLKARERLKNK